MFRCAEVENWSLGVVRSNQDIGDSNSVGRETREEIWNVIRWLLLLYECWNHKILERTNRVELVMSFEVFFAPTGGGRSSLRLSQVIFTTKIPKKFWNKPFLKPQTSIIVQNNRNKILSSYLLLHFIPGCLEKLKNKKRDFLLLYFILVA